MMHAAHSPLTLRFRRVPRCSAAPAPAAPARAASPPSGCAPAPSVAAPGGTGFRAWHGLKQLGQVPPFVASCRVRSPASPAPASVAFFTHVCGLCLDQVPTRPASRSAQAVLIRTDGDDALHLHLHLQRSTELLSPGGYNLEQGKLIAVDVQ